MKEQEAAPSSEQEQVRVVEALSAASKQYGEYVRLAQLAEFTSSQSIETLSYRRNWTHPLGLVITK